MTPILPLGIHKYPRPSEICFILSQRVTDPSIGHGFPTDPGPISIPCTSLQPLHDNDNILGLLSFNIDPAESDNSVITPSQISERLGIAIKEIPPESDFNTTISQARFGKELWKEFLLIALILLVIESLLGRSSPLASNKSGQGGND